MLEQLQKIKKVIMKNLANLFTGIRIIATFILCSKIMNILLGKKTDIGEYIWIAILFLIIWISDITDGKVARKLNVSSMFGAKFDVIADNIFVFMLHILLAFYHIVPIWFIVLMLEKIMNYIVSSYIISRKTNGRFDFIRDPLGKVLSASYFITPCLLLASYMIGEEMYFIANILIEIIAILGIASSVYRMSKVFQMNGLKRKTKEEGI